MVAVLQFSSGVMTLRNVTITGNSVLNAGGGGFFNTGTVNPGNTIIASNDSTLGTHPEIEFSLGTITSNGGNLVCDSPGDAADTGMRWRITSGTSSTRRRCLGLFHNNGGTIPQ